MFFQRKAWLHVVLEPMNLVHEASWAFTTDYKGDELH